MARTVNIYEIEIGMRDQPRHWIAAIGEGVTWEDMRLTRDEALRLCIALIEVALTDDDRPSVMADLATLGKVRALVRDAS